ncbi:hypothetical protein [uncultured Clostridium sp.]|uniref:hypothetical protein n=1 Tax=uncultured Clostridium sp. TaxID=59620 RepID=UPI0026235B5F|nr:hypothetical protein [uncultured Clostridium sp.]
MKIIKDNYNKTYQVTCPDCGSIFEFTNQDVKSTTNCDYIFCPLCEEVIKLTPDETFGYLNVKRIFPE